MGLPIITMSEAKEIVRLTVSEGEKRPLFFLGKGGIGKSASIEALAKELNIGYIDIRLLLYTETDIKGIPYPDDKREYTVWLQNDILPRVERDGDKGILVFDEITSAMKSVRTAIYQLLNERRLGDYVLPEGWTLVCLGNGEEDGGDYNGLEGNFANRCSLFRVQPDIDAFKEYALLAGFNDDVIAYLNWCNEDLQTYNDDVDSEENLVFASPRSWKAVSDILNRTGNMDRITQLRIKSNIGTLVGEKFITFCDYKSAAVNIDDIINGKEVKQPKNAEAVYLTIQSLVSRMCEILALDNVSRASYREETYIKCANGVKWLLSLNKLEYAVMGIKDFITHDKVTVPTLLLSDTFDKYCPELEKFATKNKEVFR